MYDFNTLNTKYGRKHLYGARIAIKESKLKILIIKNY